MEKAVGILRRCFGCGETFWSSEGNWICSSDCEEELDQQFYEERMKDLEGQLDDLLCDLVGGYTTHAEFARAWNLTLAAADFSQDLDSFDIHRLAEKKKEEYGVSDLSI